MKKLLTMVALTLATTFAVFADTTYEVVGQDTGTVQFDYENGGKLFTVIGSRGQTFKTRWSGCGATAVYAYRDYVSLISTELVWESFPEDASSFINLDWEQRAPAIHEGKYVVFMNDAGQFLACKVVDVKRISRGDDEDLLTFEFKVYDTDPSVAAEIIRVHEDKKSDYVLAGKNEGTAQFDFENNSGQFIIIGTNNQSFTTMWSGCGANSIHAYRDHVRLISDEVDWESFPSDAGVFATLNWEQRSSEIHEGKFVVFMNATGQFLCCKIIDVKDASRGESDDFIEFEYKIYDVDASISTEIIRLHEEKQNGYAIEGANEGSAQFDFANNSGRFVIIGENDQEFITRWSRCGSKSIYAYRDDVKNVGLCDSLTDFPAFSTSFISIERGQRVVTAHEGDYVVFMNDLGQFLCCHITEIKTKASDEDDDLLTFDYKIYDANAAVLDAIVSLDNSRGESRLSDDFIITADLSSDRIINIPDTVNNDFVKVKIVRIVKNGGSRVKHDITDFLEIPKAENGIIDLTKIQVKAMYAAEVFNVERGAKLILENDRIYIETANTREGLIYDFYEADDLNNLMNAVKESKVGDGAPFIPNVSTEKTNSRFFAIKVRAM